MVLKKAIAMNWVEKDGKLTRLYVFATFQDAMSFVSQVAQVAEEMDHHPGWRNVYNKVWVDLTTHDAGQVTDLDFRLAEAMDKIASKYQSSP